MERTADTLVRLPQINSWLARSEEGTRLLRFGLRKGGDGCPVVLNIAGTLRSASAWQSIPNRLKANWF
jgi:hypothetical protein